MVWRRTSTSGESTCDEVVEKGGFVEEDLPNRLQEALEVFFDVFAEVLVQDLPPGLQRQRPAPAGPVHQAQRAQHVLLLQSAQEAEARHSRVEYGLVDALVLVEGVPHVEMLGLGVLVESRRRSPPVRRGPARRPLPEPSAPF